MTTFILIERTFSVVLGNDSPSVVFLKAPFCVLCCLVNIFCIDNTYIVLGHKISFIQSLCANTEPTTWHQGVILGKKRKCLYLKHQAFSSDRIEKVIHVDALEVTVGNHRSQAWNTTMIPQFHLHAAVHTLTDCIRIILVLLFPGSQSLLKMITHRIKYLNSQVS